MRRNETESAVVAIACVDFPRGGVGRVGGRFLRAGRRFSFPKELLGPIARLLWGLHARRQRTEEPLPELLGALARQRASCVVRLTSSSGPAEVYLSEGQAVAVEQPGVGGGGVVETGGGH